VRALVVSAHPDDIEFGSAGTIATWTADGWDVTYCIVSDGSTGTQDRALIGERLAAVRRQESKRAAAVVGVDDIEWLGYRDGYIEFTLELRRAIARVFRRARPHRYMVMDPTPTIEDRFVNHPDHRAVGQASLDVTLTAGTTPGHFPELLDEGLQPWRGLRELWIMGPGHKPVARDVSEVIDRKIEALLCHESQVGADAQRIAEWVKERAAAAGAPHGYRYAETFQVITQGPGFHDEDVADDVEGDIAHPPLDPAAAPVRRRSGGPDASPGGRTGQEQRGDVGG
jgi:LmbE family N-acetylglucosaminyl deacetylase